MHLARDSINDRDMTLCVFEVEPLPDGHFRHTCQTCGRPHISTQPSCKRACETYGPPRPGLGDLVANGLDGLGITKERFSAWLGAECNCPERQKKLNRAGRYLKLRAAKLGITLPF
jgi:hypothetical protein